MLLILYGTLLVAVAAARNDDNRLFRENERVDDDREPKIEESFDSPVYSPSTFFRPAVVNEKSAYNTPATVLPASYPPFPASFRGYSPPYAYAPYSRYATAVPYSVPAAYGTLLSNPAIVSALMSSYGYTGYGGPYFGRTAYSNFGYGYPNYVSGVSYPSVAIRRATAPIVSAPAPILPVPPLARAAPLAAVAPPMAGFVAPVTGPLPYRSVQSKDGTIRTVGPQRLY